MNESIIVALKITTMFVVIALGYFCRRRALLDAQSSGVLARLCTDITLPALIFLQMVETVDAQSLRIGWIVPVLAVVGCCIGFATGWASWRLFALRSQAPVFIFASGMSNWIYLPLPIVESLYGKEGMQIVFLCNLGIQPLFWSLGVAIMHSGRLDSKSIKNLATNPGLIATILGILCATLIPASLLHFATHQPGRSFVVIFTDAFRLLGQATIPISLIVTGAQIATASMVQNRAIKPLTGIVINRLFLAPLVCIGMLYLTHILLPAIPTTTLLVIALVLIMPVSLTSTVLTERMDQDTALAAQSVLYTTLVSIASVPMLFSLTRYIMVSSAGQ